MRIIVIINPKGITQIANEKTRAFSGLVLSFSKSLRLCLRIRDFETFFSPACPPLAGLSGLGKLTNV